MGRMGLMGIGRKNKIFLFFRPIEKIVIGRGG